MKCPKCGSENTKFLYTLEDWYAGDADDYYDCLDCGHHFRVYIPR
jgi:DNA-directed RNA polymerase subunit M/transcription elongation factor TFIIS